MSKIDLEAPATVFWGIGEDCDEKSGVSLKEAVRFAKEDLSRSDFLTAYIVCGDLRLSGQQIAEVYETDDLRIYR